MAENRICCMGIFGSLSSVGVGFFESRSFIAFKGIFMLGLLKAVFGHNKQTSKCQSLD